MYIVHNLGYVYKVELRSFDRFSRNSYTKDFESTTFEKNVGKRPRSDDSREPVKYHQPRGDRDDDDDPNGDQDDLACGVEVSPVPRLALELRRDLLPPRRLRRDPRRPDGGARHLVAASGEHLPETAQQTFLPPLP